MFEFHSVLLYYCHIVRLNASVTSVTRVTPAINESTECHDLLPSGYITNSFHSPFPPQPTFVQPIQPPPSPSNKMPSIFSRSRASLSSTPSGSSTSTMTVTSTTTRAGSAGTLRLRPGSLVSDSTLHSSPHSNITPDQLVQSPTSPTSGFAPSPLSRVVTNAESANGTKRGLSFSGVVSMIVKIREARRRLWNPEPIFQKDSAGQFTNSIVKESTPNGILLPGLRFERTDKYSVVGGVTPAHLLMATRKKLKEDAKAYKKSNSRSSELPSVHFMHEECVYTSSPSLRVPTDVFFCRWEFIVYAKKRRDNEYTVVVRVFILSVTNLHYTDPTLQY